MLPLLIPFIERAGLTVGSVLASKALKKYLVSPSKIPVKTNLPVVRKVDLPVKKQTALEKVSDIVTLESELVGERNELSTISRRSVKEMATDLVKTGKELETFNTKALEEFKDAPLIKFQVELKKSVEGITEAINSSTLSSLSLFSSLDSNLLAISGGLMAINKTLAELTPSLITASEYSIMRTELEYTPVVVKDFDGLPLTKSDGSPVGEISPYELKMARNASLARYHTDINNDRFDEDDLPSIDDFSFPFVPFLGRSNVYNPAIDMTVMNPFMPTGLGASFV